MIESLNLIIEPCCYGLGMGARTIRLKTFILHTFWVSLGSPCPFWCGGVVGPKPFAAAQCALSTYCKIAVQTSATACLQIRGLCWYPSEGTFGLYQVYQLLPVVFISLGKVKIRFKFTDIRYPAIVIDWLYFHWLSFYLSLCFISNLNLIPR